MAAWLSLEEALQQASSHIRSITDIEHISVFTACGRVLAEDICAPINVPPWDNSAMDGYAIQLGDNAADNLTLTVNQTVKAGELSKQQLTDTTCARIMTGAPIPPGTDTVVMQENVERNGDTIRFIAAIKKGDNIRPKASDIAENDVLFHQGHKLSAQDLMLLSSVGLAEVCVYRRLKVAIVATGDELAQPGEACSDKQIFESHRAGLQAKLSALGCVVTDAGILRDHQDSIVEAFSHLAAEHDMVISSGGVSVGEADWVKPALSSLGQLHLWKLAIKPGKPFAFGQFGNCYFCGLPGNPVSAFVTFEQIVTPLIAKLSNQNNATKRLALKAKLQDAIKRRAGRLEFARGIFYQDELGQLHVSLLPKQSSSVMTTLTKANCYLVIPATCERLDAGQLVDIQPFSLFN